MCYSTSCYSNNIEKNYDISRDYETLFKILIESHATLVCFINQTYSHGKLTSIIRSIGKIKIDYNSFLEIELQEKTLRYVSYHISFEEFEDICGQYNLTYIYPVGRVNDE